MKKIKRAGTFGQPGEWQFDPDEFPECEQMKATIIDGRPCI